MVKSPAEHHFSHRTGWLRAAVLGANDGIVSVSSLIIGVAASDASQQSVLIAGIAGLVAGAMSMAAGEYVSVSSQADTERADLEREKQELADNEPAERQELAAIYVRRGLDPALANVVAEQLMKKDALAAHARDEIGISDVLSARPIQAAFTSAAAFAIGAILPLTCVLVSSITNLVWIVAAVSLACLAALGALAASMGGASVLVGASRVVFWGVVAMLLTAGVGALFGVSA